MSNAGQDIVERQEDSMTAMAKAVTKGLRVVATSIAGMERNAARICTEAAFFVEKQTDEIGLLRQSVADKDAEITRLREIVDKLPKTADGVAAIEGELVYCPVGHPCDEWRDDGMPHCGVCQHKGLEDMDAGVTYRVKDCYSTEAAALDAKRAEVGK